MSRTAPVFLDPGDSGNPYVTLDVPPTPDPTPDPSPISTDLTCEECGTPLLYGGRGRKPRFCEEHKPARQKASGSRAKSSTATVETAVQSLDGLYDMMQVSLFMVSPRAASHLLEGQEAMQAKNRRALEQTPKMAAKIAAWGNKGGGLAFVVAQAMYIAPAVQLMMADLPKAAPKVKSPSYGRPTVVPNTAGPQSPPAPSQQGAARVTPAGPDPLFATRSFDLS